MSAQGGPLKEPAGARHRVPRDAMADSVDEPGELVSLRVRWPQRWTVALPCNHDVMTMQHVIHITLRAIGNSQGIVLPKPILAQAGLTEAGPASK